MKIRVFVFGAIVLFALVLLVGAVRDARADKYPWVRGPTTYVAGVVFHIVVEGEVKAVLCYSENRDKPTYESCSRVIDLEPADLPLVCTPSGPYVQPRVVNCKINAI